MVLLLLLRDLSNEFYTIVIDIYSYLLLIQQLRHSINFIGFKDHTWRRTVHGDHYVTGNIPGAESDWGFM